MKTYRIDSPLFVTLENGKKYYLNLNNLLRKHWVITHKAKMIYYSLMEKEIKKLPKMNKISLVFKLVRGTKRKSDRPNICCATQKFFCDALVHHKTIIDDDDEFVLDENYKTGLMDRNKGRVEVYIKHLK